MGHSAWVRGLLQVTMPQCGQTTPWSPDLDPQSSLGDKRTGHPSPEGLQHLWEKAPDWPSREDREDGVDVAEGGKAPSSGLQCPGQDAPQGGRYLVHTPDIQSQSILQPPPPHTTLPGRTMTITLSNISFP